MYDYGERMYTLPRQSVSLSDVLYNTDSVTAGGGGDLYWEDVL